MKYTYPLLSLFAIIATFSTSAQESDSLSRSARDIAQLRHDDEIADTRTVFINGDRENQAPQDSVKSLLEIFYVNQYRQFHDPQAPYFMFLTRDANVAMGIGGAIRLRAWYDWHGVEGSFAFYPYNIPVPANPARRKAIDASPSQSQIFLTLLGRNQKIGTYMVYLNIGYLDTKFVLNDAFIRVRDFTAGYTKSTFWDPEAYAPVVDGQGPNGQISMRSTLVRYFHTFKSGWSVAGGVEFPSSQSHEVEGVTEKSPDYVPDIVGLGQYSWDGGASHIRLSGLFRMLAYRDLIAGKNHSIVGWGAQLSGLWRTVSPLTVYYQGVVGRGIGGYLGDLSMDKYDLVNNLHTPGEMKAPMAYGVTAGLQYDFGKKYFISGAFGHCRYFNSDAEPDDYKAGYYGAANFFWNITPRFQTGAGYIIGSRRNFSGDHEWMNRFQILLGFNF